MLNSILTRIANFWYFLSAPPEVAPNAPFEARERVRRGKVASWILLVVMVVDLAPIFGVLGKPSIILTLLIVFFIRLIALLFNRAGKIQIAGIILLLTIQLGLLGTFLNVPGGAGSVDLPLLDVLLEAGVAAAVMLAPSATIVIMIINMTLIWLVLTYGHLSGELTHIFQIRGFSILEQAFELQFIIAVFLFIISKSANIAIKRADRAETIADLERKEITRQEEEIKQKQQLDQAVEQILQTLQSFSNGDLNAQVPISQDSILFRVSYSINTLFARLRSSRLAEKQLQEAQAENYKLRAALSAPMSSSQKQQQLEAAIQQLADNLRKGTQLQFSGTALDEVIATLQNMQRKVAKAPFRQV